MAYWLLFLGWSVTVGGNERGINAKTQISVNSGGHVVQPRSGVIRLFGWVVIIDANGNDQRYRLRYRFRLREWFRFCYWFGYYERLRKHLWYEFNRVH
jgi:hypothetical protein